MVDAAGVIIRGTFLGIAFLLTGIYMVASHATLAPGQTDGAQGASSHHAATVWNRQPSASLSYRCLTRSSLSDCCTFCSHFGFRHWIRGYGKNILPQSFLLLCCMRSFTTHGASQHGQRFHFCTHIHAEQQIITDSHIEPRVMDLQACWQAETVTISLADLLDHMGEDWEALSLTWHHLDHHSDH